MSGGFFAFFCFPTDVARNLTWAALPGFWFWTQPLMNLITDVIKLRSPGRNMRDWWWQYIYQQTEQSDDALVGNPHDEGRLVRVETPVGGGGALLAGTVRADWDLAGQFSLGLGGRSVALGHLHVEVGRHLILEEKRGPSLLRNCSLPACPAAWETGGETGEFFSWKTYPEETF